LSARATDAHEAVVVLQRHGAAIGAEGKMADANFTMRGLGGVGRESHRNDLRIGEANRGNGDRVEGALLASVDLGDHFALRHRAMGEHGFAGHVADRPDVAHRRRALGVDTNERPAHRKVKRLEAEARRMGASADRDQHLVGDNGALLAVRRGDLERAVSVRNRLRADQSLDAKIGQAPHDRLRQLCVVKWQDLGQRFDDRHLGASLAKAMPSSIPI
jgi:hypothetical protein